MKREELLKRTKKELLALAGERGARLSAKLRKSDLVDRILALSSSRGGTQQGRRRTAPKKKESKRSRNPRAEMRSPSLTLAAPSLRSSEPPVPGPADLQRISEEICRLFPPPIENSEIVFYEIDPFHGHVFWHVRLDQMEAARSSMGPAGQNAALLLRFYDVTLIRFDGFNAHGHFDVAVHSLRSNYYVDFWESGRSYIVDIGLRTDDGQFLTLLRSNHIELPPHAPSNNFDRTGIVVDSKIHVVCEVADVARAETLADIRPEPRPDMEAETSDQLVRTFYRQLTEHGLPTLNHRARERLAGAGPPASAAESPFESLSLRQDFAASPESSPESPPENRPGGGGGERTASKWVPGRGGIPVAQDRLASGSQTQFVSVTRTAAPGIHASSYSFYEQSESHAAMSSWTASQVGAPSAVTSTGAAGSGPQLLERVLTVSPEAHTGPSGIENFHAELIIQGRVRPGDQLHLMGESVNVRPDGTFNIRKRLGEGTMVVPLPQDAPRSDDPADKAVSR